jgi:tRNA nucleotidyltransferase (CCA-adding enzyme)
VADITFFKVGGCVRDELLGVDTKDIDFAVEADSYAAMRDHLVTEGFRIYQEREEFLAIRAQFPASHQHAGLNADFVLCRADGPSTDKRRPDFVQAGTILDDLARRDFTVNAMAKDMNGVLIDPYYGKHDLETGWLRFVGNPSDRLAEDGLRAFRGVRFEITKKLTLDLDAERAIRSLSPDDFDGVSTERMRDELMLMFAHDPWLSLDVLAREFQNLLDVVLERGIWFKPTMEDR